MAYVEIFYDSSWSLTYHMVLLSKEEFEVRNGMDGRVVLEVDDNLWKDYTVFLAESNLWQEKMAELESEFFDSIAPNTHFGVSNALSGNRVFESYNIEDEDPPTEDEEHWY